MGNHPVSRQSRDESRDLAFEETKTVTLTMRKCWKSWAILTITVTNAHQNVQKQRDSQGEIDFSPKGGVGGRGVENGKKPYNTQFFMVKSGRYGPLLGSKAADSSASDAESSAFECEGGSK
jgi:hypothetical protein